MRKKNLVLAASLGLKRKLLKLLKALLSALKRLLKLLQLFCHSLRAGFDFLRTSILVLAGSLGLKKLLKFFCLQ